MKDALPDTAPLSDLLPHAPPMLLLHRVLDHSESETTCALYTGHPTPLFRARDGVVPGWLAIEYMAQCCAVHGGLLARARGVPARRGLLLGSRRVELRRATFPTGTLLHVSARPLRLTQRMLSFDCRVRHPETADAWAEARLSIALLDPATGA